MTDCCTPGGYQWIFSRKSAESQAKRYRRKGLDATSRRLFDVLRHRDLQGLTLLEVGGGIGDLQIELLKAGVARAVSIELTPTYEEAAAALLREAGLEGRVERRVVDFANAEADIEAADIVVLNRVVCCYPDMPRLATAAANHARDVIVLSFPRGSWWTRALLGVGNIGLRVARRGFHVFVHSPAEIFATVEQRGLRPAYNSRGLFWQVAALERPA